MKTTFQYNNGWTGYVILLTAGSKDAKSNPTLAAGDVTVSKNGGAFANITTLPTVSPASGVQVKVVLSFAETQARHIMIRFKDQTATAEWEEQTIVLEIADNTEGRMQYGYSGLYERGGIVSENITRAGYPMYLAVFTTKSSVAITDYNENLLPGGVILDNNSGRTALILGGYYFSDGGDTTSGVFGIASGTAFGVSNGGSTIIDTNWAGVSANDLDEPGAGDGWTFICSPLNYTGYFSASTEPISVWINENASTYLTSLTSTTVDYSLIVSNGNTAGWNTTNANVTGILPSVLSSIVASGTAAGWATDSNSVTVSGLTAAALSQIVVSGNAALWNADTTNVTVSGYTSSALSQIVASGNAAGWNAATVNISDIVASGNAAGWNTSVSAQDILDIVSGVWANTVDGTADAETALKYILAYCAGDSSRTGNAYTYRDFDNSSNIMTLTGTNSSRTRS